MLRGGQSLGSSDRGHLHTMECPVHPAGQWVGVRFVPVASVPSVRGRRRCGPGAELLATASVRARPTRSARRRSLGPFGEG